MLTIDDKLKQGRCETIEFITTINEIADIAKVAVSFANNNGGSIFIGVNKKGKLIGIDPKPELKLVDETYSFIDGELVLENIVHRVKHYFVLELFIKKSVLPLKLKTNTTSLYYYRVGMESLEANKIIASFLNMKKFQKSILLTTEHLSLLNYMQTDVNLSSLYKGVDFKPKAIDRLLSELIYLDKVKIHFVNKSFYYSKK